MVVVLGAVALVLAIVGIYGVVGFAVLRRMKGTRHPPSPSERQHDRSAACRSGPGLKPILIGLALGATFAVAGSFGLQQIFRSSPVSLDIANPLPYVAVSLLLVCTAIAAMLVPGLKAAFTIPAESLRED